MKIFLKKASVAAALLAGVVGMSAAQAADVSHAAKNLTGSNGNYIGSATFGKSVAAGSTFTDKFVFTLSSATGWNQLTNFTVTSLQSNPALDPAVTGLDLSGFVLSSTAGYLYTTPAYAQTGVVDEWSLPSLLLANGTYTLSVSGTVHSFGSVSLNGKVVSAVPEPETYGMLLGGLGLLGLVARRQRQAGKNS